MTNTSGRDAAIKGLRQYREELLDQLREVEASIVKFGGELAASKDPVGILPHDGLMASGLGPQQLVEEYLRERTGRFFTVQVIAKDIVASGYRPNSPRHWITQVRNCARVAVKKGIAELREDPTGKRRFGFKQTPETATKAGNQGSSGA